MNLTPDPPEQHPSVNSHSFSSPRRSEHRRSQGSMAGGDATWSLSISTRVNPTLNLVVRSFEVFGTSWMAETCRFIGQQKLRDVAC